MKAASRLRGSLGVAAVAAALLTGCAGPGAPPVAVVQIRGEWFEPATQVIAPGTEVRWTSTSVETHTVTSGGPGVGPSLPSGADAFDSGPMVEGETFSRRFDVQGEYHYWCRYHRERMVGTIRVEAS